VSSSSPHCAAILNQRQAPFSASDWCQGRATPKLVNSDGEGIVFSETRFPITDRVRSAAIEKRLDGLAELVRDEADQLAWTWLSDAPPSGSLPAGPRKAIMLKTYDGRGGQVLGSVRLDPAAVVLQTNSAERAERGRTLLSEALGFLVGSPLTRDADSRAGHGGAGSQRTC
jgi:hypothetical protein